MPNESSHILVVDDHKTNRLKMSFAVKKLGHTVDTAENGRHALEMLHSHAFDLVLLDIIMPELNGYQVLEQMKSDTALRDIPVIIVSAETEMANVVRGIELGAEDYLPKSFDAVLLKARIGACLEKKRLRDQQAAYLQQLNIENQRKSTELEQARQIQRSILPSEPPHLPHLQIAARQETASEVGGDYYDFLSGPNGSQRVIIGDATGHGVGSALMVSMTKALLMAHQGVDLVTLPGQLNAILSQVGLGRHLNMALLLLDIEANAEGAITVQAIGGGSPPIYRLRPGQSPAEILVSGLPLGITPEAIYSPTEFKLNQDEALVLMSDGLVEQFNAAGEFLGYERLIEGLAAIEPAALPAEAILEQVLVIGNDWAAGHPLHDDVTLVVLKAT